MFIYNLSSYRNFNYNISIYELRYAGKYELTKQEVEPEKIRQGPFNRTYVTNPSVKGDFIFDHIIWNRDEIVAQLGPDIIAFTVIRDPYSLFESYFSYKNMGKETWRRHEGIHSTTSQK